MKIDISFLKSDKELFKKRRVEYHENFKKLMKLRAELKTGASKPYLATSVELIVSTGRKIDEVPFDPNIKAKLMVGIETLAIHPITKLMKSQRARRKRWNNRLRGGAMANLDSQYFTVTRTMYYRINPDGSFFHRKGQPAMKSLFNNYEELVEAIVSLLGKL